MKLQKELLLLRHGKSDWNTDRSDFYRPLSKRGKQNAQQMGEWLLRQQLQPDLIISSPALRTLGSAEICCEALGIPIQSIQTDEIIYEASLSNLIQLLTSIPNEIQRLLLVGHNPGFEQLLSHFVPDIPLPDDFKLMPTSALAYLQVDSQWSTLTGNYQVQRVKNLI